MKYIVDNYPPEETIKHKKAMIDINQTLVGARSTVERTLRKILCYPRQRKTIICLNTGEGDTSYLNTFVTRFTVRFCDRDSYSTVRFCHINYGAKCKKKSNNK